VERKAWTDEGGGVDSVPSAGSRPRAITLRVVGGNAESGREDGSSRVSPSSAGGCAASLGAAASGAEWAFLSDSEIQELAERRLRGLILPALLQRLSRREIISILLAQSDLAALPRTDSADAGAGAAEEAAGARAPEATAPKFGSAEKSIVQGSGSPPAEPKWPWRAAPAATWADDVVPLCSTPPAAHELPNLSAQAPLDDAQLQLAAALAKADAALARNESACKSDRESASAPAIRSDDLPLQSDERVQRMMKNEMTLKHLADGAQHLLLQAKMEKYCDAVMVEEPRCAEDGQRIRHLLRKLPAERHSPVVRTVPKAA